MLNRIINMMSKPVAEWDVVAGEDNSVIRIYAGFYVPLGILSLIASIVALGVLGIGAEMMEQAGMSVTMGDTVVRAVTSFAIGLVMLYLLAHLGSMIAPSFDGQSGLIPAMKLFAYSSTPTLLAGVIMPFLAATIVPMMLITFASLGYSIYLIFIGAGPVMAIPKEKLAGFTVVVLAIYIALALIMYGITSMVEGLSIF